MKFKIDPWWVTMIIIGSAGGYYMFTQAGGGGQGKSATGERGDLYRAPLRQATPYCASTTGEMLARVDACLGELDPVSLTPGALQTIEAQTNKGKVFVVGDQLPIKANQMGLNDNPEIKKLMLGKDEEAVAASLRDAGVRVVVVHRDFTQALDRDSVVLSRLAQHDHLDFFQLRHITSDLYIYTVRTTSTRIPLATGDRLLAGLRARLSGNTIPLQSWAPKSVRLMATLRLQGHSLVIRHENGKNIERVLDLLASKLFMRWDREVVPEGHGLLRDRIDDVRIEVHVVMERAVVEPRERWQLFDIWELGVDGMMFKQRDGVDDERFTYLPGSEAVVRSIKSADHFLRYAAERGGWRDKRPWEADPRTRLYLTRTQHFMEREAGGGPAVRLIRGLPEVKMEEMTDSKIRQMLVDGAEWWVRNTQPSGLINYKYWPTQNRQSNDYNEVRHILQPRDLADTWRYRHDQRYLQGAKKAMDWLLRYQVHDTDAPHATLPHPPDGTMLFRYPFKLGEVPNKPPNQKLGTVAVAVLGWVAWAESSGDHSQDENIRKMGKFILSQVEANGKFTPYYVDLGHKYHNERNDIVPGEAALALGEIAEYFGETHWLDNHVRFLDFYEPWFRERTVRVRPTGRWPHSTYLNQDRLDMVQFGPWSVMANKQYYVMTGDKRAAEFGLEVADWMIDYYQWRGDRTAFPDYVGGYYKMATELPAMQTFCYSEGTAAAYHIAATFSPDTKDKYDLSTREAIRFMSVMQYDDVDSYFVGDPQILHGGVKYAMNENKIRTDYVGHGMSTLSQYLDARDYDPAVELQIQPIDVEYGALERQLWGRWVLDTSVAPELGASVPEARRADMAAQLKATVAKASFEYDVGEMREYARGRITSWNYTLGDTADGVMDMTLIGPRSRVRRRTVQVVNDRLHVVEGPVSLWFVRSDAQAAN